MKIAISCLLLCFAIQNSANQISHKPSPNTICQHLQELNLLSVDDSNQPNTDSLDPCENKIDVYVKEIRYTLPSRDIIHQRLQEIGLEHFANHSLIVGLVAHQTFLPISIASAIDYAIHNYVQKSPSYQLPLEAKHRIIEILLRDFPSALQDLEEKKLYQPLLSYKCKRLMMRWCSFFCKPTK